jgi:hypothetical protein
MPKQRRQQNPYDTVFDFIFGSYKPKPDRRKPGPPITMPPMDATGALLAQMAMAPYMFPTNQFLGDMDREIDNLGMAPIQISNQVKLKVGPSSIGKMIGNPRGFINKAFEDYEAGKKWGKWGGVTRGMDQALVAIMAKRAGFDASAALGIGGGLGAAASMSGQLEFMGYEASQTTNYRAQQTAASNLARYGQSRFGGLGIAQTDIERIIGESAKAVVAPGSRPSYSDKAARRQKVIDELVARGVSVADANSYADKVWGTNAAVVGGGDESLAGKDLGIWLQNGDGLKKKNPITGRNEIVEGHFNNSNEVRTAALLSSIELLTERERVEADPTKRARIAQLRRWMGDYSSGKTPAFAMGRRIGAMMHYQQWLKADIFSGKLLTAVLWGNTKDIKDILSFEGFNTKLATPAGALVKLVDTWHPVNVIKGLTWNGKTWERAGGWLENNHLRPVGAVFKVIGKLTPQQLWQRAVNQLGISRLKNRVSYAVKVRFANFASRILNKAAGDLMGLPAKEILKQIATQFVTKVISKVFSQVLANAVLPGVGIVVGVVIDWAIGILMKLAKPMVELITLLILGAIALILMMFSSGAPIYNRLHRHLNLPITFNAAAASRADWATDSTSPSGTSCPITVSAINCTQGTCGGASHNIEGQRAVDLTWAGMAGSPQIVAPTDGTVIRTQASISCKDGTSAGGIVEFQDSNGYTWLFGHTRALVAAGTTVVAGTAIAEVQFEPEVQRGRCWTGAHVHTSIQNASGQYVDSNLFLNGTGCAFVCPVGQSC